MTPDVIQAANGCYTKNYTKNKMVNKKHPSLLQSYFSYVQEIDQI